MTYLGGAAFLAASLLFGFYTTDPNAPKWAVLEVYAAIIAAAWAFQAIRYKHISYNNAGLAALALFGYVALSLLWSPDWREGAHQLKDAAVVLVAFLYLSTRPRYFISYIPELVALMTLVLLGLLVKWPGMHGGIGNENFAGELVLMALPLCLLAWWRHWRRWYGIFPLAAVVGSISYLLLVNDSNNKWAVAGIAGAGLLFYCWKRKHFRTLAALAGFGGVAIYTVWSGDINHSIWARAEFWYNSAQTWLDAPILGHGAGSFNFVYPVHQLDHLSLLTGSKMTNVTTVPGNAHNEVLQLLVEFGVAGLAIAGVFCWAVFKSVRWNPRLARASVNVETWAYAAVIVFGATLSLVGFPLRVPQTILLFVVAAAVLARNGDRVKVPISWLRFTTPLVPAAMIGIVVMGGYAYAAEMKLSVTRAYLGNQPVLGLQTNMDAHALYPYSRRIRHQLVLSVAAAIRKKYVKITPEAADMAYKISRTASPYSPGIMLARVEYLLNSERRADPEAGLLLDDLKRNASVYAGVWLADAAYAYYVRDAQRALDALLRVREFDLPPEKLKFMEHIASQLEQK